MESNEINLESLKDFFYKEFQINKNKVNGNSSLLSDLEFRGDDVDDIFTRLVRYFKIDVKKLDLSRFNIGDEPGDFISPVVRSFKMDDLTKKPTITIHDIEKFIKTGILE